MRAQSGDKPSDANALKRNYLCLTFQHPRLFSRGVGGNTALDCLELVQNDRCGLNFLAGLVASQLVTALCPVRATVFFLFPLFSFVMERRCRCSLGAIGRMPLSAAVLVVERAFLVYCRHANCIKYCQAIKAYCCSLNM